MGCVLFRGLRHQPMGPIRDVKQRMLRRALVTTAMNMVATRMVKLMVMVMMIAPRGDSI